MIREVTYQKEDGKMKTKWIFRSDNDLTKNYSDFKTMEMLLNQIYDQFPALTREVFAELEGGENERGENI